MSNNNDSAGSIDTAAFGLPSEAGGESNVPTPGFMYDGHLEVDENDPIYQATVAAMEAQGMEIPPKPGEEERPPVMPTSEEAGGEPPATPDPSAADDEAPKPPITEATPGEQPPIEPGTEIQPPPAADDDTDDGEPPAADSLAFQVDGADVTLNTEQAEYLLRVNTWLENIPPETKTAWAGIEQGTHVAISAQELADLKAAAAASPKPPANSPAAPDLDDLDDDTANYIRSLEARVPPQQQGGQQDLPPGVQPQGAPGQPQTDTAELQAAFRHQEEQRTAMMGELAKTNEAVKERYNLTDEQLEHLGAVTTQLQVIPAISRQLTQYSPTGQVIHQAPFGEVVERAYEVAMSQDPALRQIRDDIAYNARVAKEAERNSATNAKKAKAGTLAASPSAAVPANGKGPQISPDNKMDLQGTSEAIAAHLASMSETP